MPVASFPPLAAAVDLLAATALLAAVALLAGCTAGPDDVPPKPEVPVAWETSVILGRSGNLDIWISDAPTAVIGESLAAPGRRLQRAWTCSPSRKIVIVE